MRRYELLHADKDAREYHNLEPDNRNSDFNDDNDDNFWALCDHGDVEQRGGPVRELGIVLEVSHNNSDNPNNNLSSFVPIFSALQDNADSNQPQKGAAHYRVRGERDGGEKNRYKYYPEKIPSTGHPESDRV